MGLFDKYEKRIAHISIAAIFLGLIRCISEFYRLEYLLNDKLTIAILKPFITGALIAAISAFVMVLLYFFSKYKLIPVAAIIAIIVMLIVKAAYNIG
jgi:hypothetical protein